MIIAPTSITSSVAASAGSTTAGLINGTGLSAALATGADTATALTVTHSSGTIANNYVSGSPSVDYFTSGTPPVFTIDFGASYNSVDSILLWNYAMLAAANAPSNNSTRAFTLQFYSDAAATSLIGTETGLPLARSVGGAGALQVAQQISFSTQYDNVRAVTMTLTDNYFGIAGGAGGDRVGLAEIRFSQVPEPTSMLLSGFGLIALLRRRR